MTAPGQARQLAPAASRALVVRLLCGCRSFAATRQLTAPCRLLHPRRRTPAERERVAELLAAQPLLGSAVPAAAAPGLPALRGSLLEAAGGWLRRVTAAWQQAKVSNFDYLLYLNLAAGRWVVAVVAVAAAVVTLSLSLLCTAPARAARRTSLQQPAPALSPAPTAPSTPNLYAPLPSPLPTSTPHLTGPSTTWASTPSCPGCWRTTAAQRWTWPARAPSGTCPSRWARSARAAWRTSGAGGVVGCEGGSCAVLLGGAETESWLGPWLQAWEAL
jgi:hypothetical protein